MSIPGWDTYVNLHTPSNVKSDCRNKYDEKELDSGVRIYIFVTAS